MHARAAAILDDAIRRASLPNMGVSGAIRIAKLAAELIFDDEERRRDDHVDQLEEIFDSWTPGDGTDEYVLEEVMAEFTAIGLVVGAETKLRRFVGGNSVFVVHGHDHYVRDEVVSAIKKLGLKPIVIADVPGSSQTIIELIEQYSDVSYAVCLMTANDIGGSQLGDQVKRARQNVVFEIGYFFALLGRTNVLVMSEPEVEVPSNIGGVRRISFTAGTELETLLRQEFAAAGVLSRASAEAA